MAVQQSKPVTPPRPEDEGLFDFAQVVQDNLAQLFDELFDLQKVTSIPTAQQGSILSMRVVKVSSTWRFYIKVDSTTWKYVALS